jgi:hypothetical protein
MSLILNKSQLRILVCYKLIFEIFIDKTHNKKAQDIKRVPPHTLRCNTRHNFNLPFNLCYGPNEFRSLSCKFIYYLRTE